MNKRYDSRMVRCTILLIGILAGCQNESVRSEAEKPGQKLKMGDFIHIANREMEKQGYDLQKWIINYGFGSKGLKVEEYYERELKTKIARVNRHDCQLICYFPAQGHPKAWWKVGGENYREGVIRIAIDREDGKVLFFYHDLPREKQL